MRLLRLSSVRARGRLLTHLTNRPRFGGGSDRRRRRAQMGLARSRRRVGGRLRGGCLVNATVGTGGLTAAGLLDPARRGESWLTWWLGDVSGVLVAAPMILAWAVPIKPSRRPFARLPELAVLLALPFAVGGAVVRT